MKDDRDFLSKIQVASDIVGQKYGADVIFFAGKLYPDEDYRFNKLVRHLHSRQNVILLLSTFGGIADSAYRITRCLQEVYESGKVIVFVHSFCKSAGTLLALGAHEIIMSDGAEFGPLDVQLRKPDEFDERTSGLTPTQAMSIVRQEAYQAFEEFFIGIRRKTGITSRTAAEIAANLTTGLFAPIYGQLDPLRLGENERAMLVAEEYGSRLAAKARNLRPGALASLTGGYPSHEFVIDRSEAANLFDSIRSPDDDELLLAQLLDDFARDALLTDGAQSYIKMLSTDDIDIEDDGSEEENADVNKESNAEQQPIPTSAKEAGDEIGETSPIKSEGYSSAPKGSPDTGNGRNELRVFL